MRYRALLRRRPFAFREEFETQAGRSIWITDGGYAWSVREEGALDQGDRLVPSKRGSALGAGSRSRRPRAGARRTFGSARVAAGVREHHKHVLMNHVPKRTHVGDRYAPVDRDDLHRAIEDGAAFLLERAGVAVEQRRDAG